MLSLHRDSPLTQLGRGAVFVITSCLLLMGCGDTGKNEYVAPPPPAVVFELPIEEDVTETKEFTGTTRAFEDVEIHARVEGFLDAIEFEDGDEVKAGQLLARIDDRPFKAALEQAEASLALANAQLQNAQAGLSQAQARQANAQGELQRVLAAVQRSPGSISETEIEMRRTQAATETASVEAAQAMIASAQAEISAAEAAVTTAKLNLDYTEVRSPINGRVSEKKFDVGSLVGIPGATLLTTVVQADPIYATFTLSENDFLRFNRERIAENRDMADTEAEKQRRVLFLALSDETDFTHQGYVDYTDTSIDQTTGTYLVRGRFDNPQRLIPPGAFVRIQVPLEEKLSLLVNPEAVGLDQGGSYLLVVNNDNEVEMRRVTLGGLHNGRQIIAGGELKPTDRVIVSGVQFVRPGVKVTPSEAQPEGAVEGEEAA
jgi:RND family efflux transporter MFP subunit